VLTDPIADMLTCVRNAVRVKRPSVNVPYSREKHAIAKVLKDEGFIADFAKVDDEKQGLLRVYLKYTAEGQPVVSQIRRVSKPGQRIYKSLDEIRPVKSGLGIAILSTPKGVLSDRECRKAHVGGELICTVW